MFHAIVRTIAFFFFKILYRPKILGKENLPKDGSFILVANHLGKVDVFAIASLFKRKVYFLAKKEWFDKKLKSKFFKWAGGIPVDRENVDVNSIKNCFATLKKGNVLIIFPEGTRNRSQEVPLLQLKGGASMIAFKSKSNVVPVFMYKKYKIFRKNYICIGEPYNYSNYNGQKLSPELSDTITQEMTQKLLDCKAKVDEFAKNKGKK